MHRYRFFICVLYFTHLNTFLWKGARRFHQSLKGYMAQKRLRTPGHHHHHHHHHHHYRIIYKTHVWTMMFQETFWTAINHITGLQTVHRFQLLHASAPKRHHRGVSYTKQYKLQDINLGSTMRCLGACNTLYLRLPEDGALAPKNMRVVVPYVRFVILLCASVGTDCKKNVRNE